MAFILVVELGVATSMYAYKDRLTDGFDKGLENSMLSYGPDDPTRTIDFFWMQRKVNLSLLTLQCVIWIIFFSLFIRIQLQCCGNHGYDDWNKLPRPMPVPKSCCKMPNCDVQDETQIYLEVSHSMLYGLFDFAIFFSI